MIQRAALQPAHGAPETTGGGVQNMTAAIIASMSKASVLLLAFLAVSAAAEPASIALWPGTPPGENHAVRAGPETASYGDRLVGGKRILRVSNVSRPEITIYHPFSTTSSGATAVVCPGGGYQVLAMDLEGTEICAWLQSIGMTAILLKYRVPSQKGQAPYAAPLQDVQRALSLVRFHASEWHLDPAHIGIIGFSAGGDLAALASTRFKYRAYSPLDNADRASCRPDFAMLIYPGLIVGKADLRLAPEITVTSNTPPTFLVQAEDDPVHVENSLDYYLALKGAKVPTEMHLYATGGHGYGLRATGRPISGWPKLAEAWLDEIGVLNDSPPIRK
jgi:acetyl esterase/lipase